MGKTHLATAAAWTLMDAGVAVLYVVVPDLLATLRETFDVGVDETHAARMRRIRDADVVILDDLGSENGTPWVREQLFSIVNHRYLERTPLLVASNYTPEGIGGRIGSRLADRGLVTYLSIDADDYRRLGMSPRGISGPGD